MTSGGLQAAATGPSASKDEAALLGLALEQAVARVGNGGLPRTPVGYELTDLIRHLRLA